MFSWISKYRGPFRSKPRCYDRAYTKNHTQEPSMAVGPRDLISSDTVLASFDPSLSTQVRHDACKIGISGTLTQKHPDGVRVA